MKKYFMFFCLLVLSKIAFGEEIVNIEDIRNKYCEILMVQKHEYQNKVYFLPVSKKVSDDHFLSEFINYNSFYITYLFTHTIKKYDRLKHLESVKDDSMELQEKFIHSLIQDTLFTHLFEDYLFNYITSTGVKIKGFKKVQKEISFYRLIDIAVKFFYIPELSNDGVYKTKFCAVKNGILETEDKRDLHLEAFCFDTFADSIQQITPIFIKELEDIAKLNLGLDQEQKLQRAQGAIYLAMSRNDKIIEFIKNEYQRKKSYLPFRITELQ